MALDEEPRVLMDGLNAEPAVKVHPRLGERIRALENSAEPIHGIRRHGEGMEHGGNHLVTEDTATSKG